MKKFLFIFLFIIILVGIGLFMYNSNKKQSITYSSNYTAERTSTSQENRTSNS
jgi:cbb3-type cytochrome oxidase subunit 3